LIRKHESFCRICRGHKKSLCSHGQFLRQYYSAKIDQARLNAKKKRKTWKRVIPNDAGKLDHLTAEKLRELWPEKTFAEIAKKYACQPSSIYRKLKKLDTSYWWSQNMGRKKCRRRRVLAWAILWENQDVFFHRSSRELAKELGVTQRTIHRWRSKIRQAKVNHSDRWLESLL